MDWNWLYSSLAQSAAAIVGIISAFVITKVVSNQSDFAVKLQSIRQLIIDADSLKDEIATRYFSWYNERIRERETKRIRSELIKSKNLDESAEEIFANAKYSIFDDSNAIIENIKKLINSEKLRKAEVSRKASIPSPFSGPNFGHLERLASPFIDHSITNELQKNLNEEREQIDGLIIKIERHIEYIKSHLNETSANPESSVMITRIVYILASMYVFGVLIPLSILPLPVNQPAIISINGIAQGACSIKGVILVIVSVLFFGILATFYRINISLKYPSELIDSLTALSRLGSYSKYLENRENGLKIHDQLKPILRRTEPKSDDLEEEFE